MQIYNFSNLQNIWVFGNIHGDINALLSIINKNLKKKINNTFLSAREETKKSIAEAEINELNRYDALLRHKQQMLRRTSNSSYENSLIIVTGSNHFGFADDQVLMKDILSTANEVLSDANTTLLFIRGNEDNPLFYDGQKIDLSNIKAIPDYSLVKTSNHTILCVGGGISIDRLWKMKKESSNTKKQIYWNSENTVVDNKLYQALKNENAAVDVVITHDAPTFVFPEINYDILNKWAKKDKNIKHDIEEERLVMDNIYANLRKSGHTPLIWFYGHYDIDNVNTTAGISFRSLSYQSSLFNVDDQIANFCSHRFQKKKKQKKSSLSGFLHDVHANYHPQQIQAEDAWNHDYMDAVVAGDDEIAFHPQVAAQPIGGFYEYVGPNDQDNNIAVEADFNG